MRPEEKFMMDAIAEAEEAIRNGDYGIGAVVVKDGRIISKARERLKSINDPINGHAEIAAIRQACKALNSGYIDNGVIYSTHEPCPMCASAIYWAKLKGIVFGISRVDMICHMNKQRENDNLSWRQINITCDEILEKTIPNLNIEVHGGFMREDCLKLLIL